MSKTNLSFLNVPTRSFLDLRVWQEAYSLGLAVYKESLSFPAEERFGLTAQLRRAATSVAANIAEGCGRKTTRDLINFLFIAKASAQEARCFCLFARDLGFLSDINARSLIERYAGLVIGIHSCISALQKTRFQRR